MTAHAAAVEAVFAEDGGIEPRRFTWRGTWVDVESIGRRTYILLEIARRRWEDDGARCLNVMAAGGRAFELRLDRATLRWTVIRGPSRPMVV